MELPTVDYDGRELGFLGREIMKEINIAEADIEAVATEIVKFASDLPSPGDLVNSRPPVVTVI